MQGIFSFSLSRSKFIDCKVSLLSSLCLCTPVTLRLTSDPCPSFLHIRTKVFEAFSPLQHLDFVPSPHFSFSFSYSTDYLLIIIKLRCKENGCRLLFFYLFSLARVCQGGHVTEDNTPVSSWSLVLWSAERVRRCLPDLSDLGGGNPADQQSQASTRLLWFSITSWASYSTHTCTHTGLVGACPRLSPAGGVLIRSLMTQLYKPSNPGKRGALVA